MDSSWSVSESWTHLGQLVSHRLILVSWWIMDSLGQLVNHGLILVSWWVMDSSWSVGESWTRLGQLVNHGLFLVSWCIMDSSWSVCESWIHCSCRGIINSILHQKRKIMSIRHPVYMDLYPSKQGKLINTKRDPCRIKFWWVPTNTSWIPRSSDEFMTHQLTKTNPWLTN
jgi:hypothetical protein